MNFGHFHIFDVWTFLENFDTHLMVSFLETEEWGRNDDVYRM